MRTHGKKYRKVAEGRDLNAAVAPKAALEQVKGAAFAKFDETVDVAIRLGVDPRHADQIVRGTVVLPAGTGKTVRVLVIAVETYGNFVHPFPPYFEGTNDEVCRHVEKFPTWVLATVVPLWSGTVAVATWLACRVGKLASGVVVGVALDTLQQVESHLLMRHYEGFVKRSRLRGRQRM